MHNNTAYCSIPSTTTSATSSSDRPVLRGPYRNSSNYNRPNLAVKKKQRIEPMSLAGINRNLGASVIAMATIIATLFVAIAISNSHYLFVSAAGASAANNNNNGLSSTRSSPSSPIAAAAASAASSQVHHPPQQQQQQPAPTSATAPVAPVPPPATSGPQLFQSPAALAAAAAAANQLAVAQPSPILAANAASNLLTPVAGVAPRVDTVELIKAAVQQQQQVSSMQQKQQQQQQQQAQSEAYNIESDCAASNGFISFELITGYVLSAPADAMVMQPGTLQLTDCLNLCRQNNSCLAINFETGLCVLLQESADKNPQALQKSQFPVFTIYAHKICLQGDRSNRCHKSWSFERVIGWVLHNLEKKTILTKTRLECLQACYNEQSFQCKSFNYDSASGSCQLSDMDRHSLPSNLMRRRHYVESTIDTIDYGENNCIQEARGICDFKPIQNRILKTVDSIYQDIKSEAECRKRCLQAPYRCHSYDLGDSSNPVCRTSHLDRNSLQQIQDPYLDIQGAMSYELESCYNVTVVCKSREMVARVKTNKLFNGKIYAKNAPLSCLNDVSNSMDFELSMAFNDACAISKSQQHNGIFSNEIVLQHNDMIVTNSDMGLNIKCQYDLRNQTVYNNINLDDFMSGREPIDIASQSAVVKSPNISMHILRHDGNPIQQAQVGDALLLRFQITDDRSPFEIFVRDLYAMDGVGGTEIMLIDGEGCPTDPSIMAAMSNAKGNGQTLEAQFDAFKFPTSETVAFRALVTPCIPHCEPVHCQNRVFDGAVYEAESFGKRRRRRRRSVLPATASASASASAPGATAKGVAPEEVVVRNSIEIKDKFFTPNLEEQQDDQVARLRSGDSKHGAGTEPAGLWQRLFARDSYLKVSGVAFLFGGLILSAQVVLLIGWALAWRQHNKQQRRQVASPATVCSGIGSLLNDSLKGGLMQQQVSAPAPAQVRPGQHSSSSSSRSSSAKSLRG